MKKLIISIEKASEEIHQKQSWAKDVKRTLVVTNNKTKKKIFCTSAVPIWKIIQKFSEDDL